MKFNRKREAPYTSSQSCPKEKVEWANRLAEDSAGKRRVKICSWRAVSGCRRTS
jgi:hypothetical protein